LQPLGHAVLGALAAAVVDRRFERKVLVCHRMGVGRELLRCLAARGVAWINVEVTTPRQLAHDLIAPDLTSHGLSVADEFDELALLDAAIDEVLANARGRLAELAEGIGLRQAIGNSVRALRQAGIGVAALERSRFRDEDKRARIARILDEYERRLRAGRLLDGAALMARAAASLAVGDARLPVAVYLMPGQDARGLSGVLFNGLVERGAVVLPADPVFGAARPVARLGTAAAADDADAALKQGASPLSWLHDVAGWSAVTSRSGGGRREDTDEQVVLDVFAATSLTAELREVLRRVSAAGLQWDEVEIITTDAAAYGVALDGLAQRLGIPVTYAAGLPAARTRPGRAVARYLEWVEQGFPADVLRQMLERGDIAVSGGSADVTGMALARRLRGMKIGRGRDRYEGALQRAEAALQRAEVELQAAQAAEADGPAEQLAEERERRRTELAALARLIRALLAATPAVPDRLTRDVHAVSPAALAGGLLALLDFVPVATTVDASMKQRLAGRLERIVASATRQSTLGGAIAVLTGKLDDRVPAPEAEGASPWTSAGGHLHLSDLEHGGYSGRRATFVVGLDAGRFPGGGGADALLVDDDRRRIAADAAALPTAAERVDERRYAFAALAARLRGRITFSYSTWDAVEGRAVAPAAELLQAYRLLSGEATADYEMLHQAVAPAASAVPRGLTLLDADDVWLNALSSNGALQRGVATVCAVHPHLAAGVAAWKTRLRSPVPTAYHGFIQPRPAHDPRGSSERVVSATQLQALGACPHRYLLRYVLGVQKPEDVDVSPEQWLPAMEKGSLLHTVYERAVRRLLETDVALESAEFEQLVLELLDEGIAHYREVLPPPGEAVFALEREQLRDDARAFVAMVREDGRRFIDVERVFGPGHDEVRIQLPDGALLGVRGAIDRVDELEDGRLVVIDYKTGSRLRFGGASGVFEGGRRLQHVLYSAAAERLFGREVARAEYQFPSRGSENHRARYDRRQMADGLGIVTDLLDLVRNGWYLPTNSADDCARCDYATVCRVRVDPFGKVDSPLAAWSREGEGPAADILRRVRR
jgi:CRISPR/Cas system-associated exonuclease Cas4 (RecB family)